MRKDKTEQIVVDNTVVWLRRGEKATVEVFRVSDRAIALWPSSVHSLPIVYAHIYQMFIENPVCTRRGAGHE